LPKRQTVQIALFAGHIVPLGTPVRGPPLPARNDNVLARIVDLRADNAAVAPTPVSQ